MTVSLERAEFKGERMIYFTSDNHFGHDAVIQFCNRPWETVEEMDEGMIRIWNEVVTPKDTVFVLGDFCFANSGRRKEILDRLHGTKILIQGNHDKGNTCPQGFDAMLLEGSIRICGKKVTMKHYPLKQGGLKGLWYKYVLKRRPRYIDRMPVDKGQWHMHGHTHSFERIEGKQIHVGIDAWDYRPVSLARVQKLINKEVSKNDE